MEKIGNFLYSVYNWVWTDSVKDDLLFAACWLGFPIPVALLQCLLAYIFGTECFFVAYYPGIVFALVILVCAVGCGIGSFRKPDWEWEYFWDGATVGLFAGIMFELVLFMEAMVLETVTGVQIFN